MNKVSRELHIHTGTEISTLLFEILTISHSTLISIIYLFPSLFIFWQFFLSAISKVSRDLYKYSHCTFNAFLVRGAVRTWVTCLSNPILSRSRQHNWGSGKKLTRLTRTEPLRQTQRLLVVLSCLKVEFVFIDEETDCRCSGFC